MPTHSKRRTKFRRPAFHHFRSMQEDDPVWEKLLLWLKAKGMNTGPDTLLVSSKHVPGAGRGLFMIKDVPPNTPLFTVPESAHMNHITLQSLYGRTMTATQVISLHIFLHRHHGGDYESMDPDFGPYISILPKDFDGHPLSWMICPRKNSNFTTFLLSSLPDSARRALKIMAGRFGEDWKAVSQFLSKHPSTAASTRRRDISFTPFIPDDSVESYLWAWLNVNTRCVYHRLGISASDTNNLTLCPLLDLANHTSASTYTSPTTPIPTYFSPQSRALKKEEEVYLRYGSHSNVTLFTEYGFVEEDPQNGGQADVQDILETLFRQKGAIGEWMEATLRATNYWGDWKLYEKPAPAQPSYRLLPALRLLHLSVTCLGGSGSRESIESPELETWQSTLLGETDIISAVNEEQVWDRLLDICGITGARAEEGLRRLKQWRENQPEELPGWGKYAVHAVETLWLEEQRVARGVMQSITDGEALD